MSGLEFAKHVKEGAPDVTLLLTTAFDINAHEISRDLELVKVDDLLKKPFMLSQIFEVIAKYLV